jgi:hypothetical protein
MFRKMSAFALLLFISLGIFILPQQSTQAACGTTNIALNKPVTVSSTEAGLTAAAVDDGNTGTRWGSAFSDPQWVQIDLGSTQSVCSVVLRWETAYGKSYQIQTSNDATTWATIYSTTTGVGGVETLSVSGSGRYIRMYGTVRATGYGYSLWEFEVYSGTVPTNTATSTNTNTPVSGSCGTTNLALNKTATSSSNEAVGTPASAAVDGSLTTRWSSAFSDPQWIQIDLGAVYSICHVKLTWEAAYGKSYQIQVSNDAATWTTIYSTTTGTGGVNDLTGLSGSGRYIRMYGTARGTAYGYSIYEFEVYSGTSSTPTFVPPTATLKATNTATATSTGTATGTATATATTGSGGCPTTNNALNRSVTASSVTGTNSPQMAVDGNTTTRWESAYSDPQWIQIDFGTTATFCRVKLNWETAAASAYQIQTSNDAATWTTIYSTTTSTGGIQDLTGLSGSGRYIRMNGTARTTQYGYSLWEFEVYGTGGVVIPTPTLSPTPDAAFWGDTSTIPPATNVLMYKFLNRTNGKYADSQIYWSFNGQTHSLADSPYFDMPANSSGRMYFYLGSPTSQYNDFIEFTIGPNDWNGNTTRVDAFGLKLAIRLHTKDGYDASVGEDEATFMEDRSVTFQKFINEVPTEFKNLAVEQAPYHIPAPAHAGDTYFTPTGQYGHYFDAYIASVGSTVTTNDIFGCTNTLGASAGQCAAFNRHVAQLPSTQWFDTSQYYLAAPANYYAKFWHDHGINHLAYGFPYDDYANQASYMTHANPQYLLIAIGW